VVKLGVWGEGRPEEGIFGRKQILYVKIARYLMPYTYLYTFPII
jgi:hypothetical protein